MNAKTRLMSTTVNAATYNEVAEWCKSYRYYIYSAPKTLGDTLKHLGATPRTEKDEYKFIVSNLKLLKELGGLYTAVNKFDPDLYATVGKGHIEFTSHNETLPKGYFSKLAKLVHKLVPSYEVTPLNDKLILKQTQ